MIEGKTAQSNALSDKRIEQVRLLAFRANTPVGIAVTFVVMVALVFAVAALNVPNPNMILITGLVICASFFGYPGGITAAVIMMAYTLAFFSIDFSFVNFNEAGLQKVVVSAIGITVITFFVAGLRHILAQNFFQLEQLNDALEEDNRLLEAATTVDDLTQARNRFGLRRDFASYLDSGACVIMFDLDNFKSINDDFGHNAGDHVLREVGATLIDCYGADHVYRYGGDEFLIVRPSVDHDAIRAKLDALASAVDALRVEGVDRPVHFSAGYTYGMPTTQSDLRFMIRQADECLYDAKNAGKNQVSGTAYSRAAAESIAPRTIVPPSRS